jgi:chromosomal replication initiation ATPase DnaA
MNAARTRQLPLDLAHAPAMGPEDFLSAPNNEAALAWIERWPGWPRHALAIHGPAGSGKTHLASIWRARAGAVPLALADLHRADPPQLLGAAPACLIDTGTWDGTAPFGEAALLHLSNWLKEEGRGLLIASRLPPARWPVALPDLRSRLSAMSAVAICAPDDALLAALLVKLFADRQLSVAPEVIDHLARRMERSCEAAGHLVEAIDKAALSAQRRIGVALAQAVLAQVGTREDDDGMSIM